jgi:hypothetical protein
LKEIFGESTVKALTFLLETKYGIRFDEKSGPTISELDHALGVLLGDGKAVILRRLIARMKEAGLHEYH